MTNCTYAEKIERWTLDRLVPYARNPRTHAPEQVAQIASSIREFNQPRDDVAGKRAGTAT